MTQGQLRRWHQGDWGLKGSGYGVCVSHDPRCLAWVTRQAVDSRGDGGDGLFEGKLIDSGLGGCSGPVGHPRGGIQLDIWDFAQKKCLVACGGGPLEIQGPQYKGWYGATPGRRQQLGDEHIPTLHSTAPTAAN